MRAGAVSATAQPGTPITLPLGDVRPPWRAPMVVRVRHHGGILTLDARQPYHPRPVARVAPRQPRVCLRRGSPTRTGLLLIAVVLVMLVSAVVGAAWLARALGAPDAVTGPRGAACMAMLAAGRHGRHVPAGGPALRAAGRTGALPVREVRRDHGDAAERRASARLRVARLVVRVRAAAAVLHRRRGRPEDHRTGRSRARPHVEPAFATATGAAPSRRSSSTARRRRRPRGIGDSSCCACARC